ncbi:hypothetical protein M5W83_06655 [Paenibacillus thiaminolyticus]|uniref:Uncharacterized protein n=1 Tax=Paenibacillus thiaminolyticus TaxID=49283 RepID=A0AAP9DR04_PANTH|nr:hypothetical protein [Paenibacillus thiaminolyticus]MCY9534806.1 hypothetical protein [Paenibacillus thiaminolyticus]MCY9603931.1 hypothetical protein [Paenibacillus thiaminolyticus]MCY9606835.1 hypothetical protein [Paenibacillus thiaminolyticus]MCY9615827.1 hypothetical protein [Paenibacillus thiaminolyticus]MCY9619061.1 hypothetical protein [Paenibacillus thiaminolyticus]
MRIFPKVLLVAFSLLVLIFLMLAYNNELGSGKKSRQLECIMDQKTTQLGHIRNSEYEDIILIVNDSTFNQIQLHDRYIGIFELNKVYGNNHGIVDMYDPQSIQVEQSFDGYNSGCLGI